MRQAKNIGRLNYERACLLVRSNVGYIKKTGRYRYHHVNIQAGLISRVVWGHRSDTKIAVIKLTKVCI